MFDRVLVPLDGTEVATISLDAGSRLAQAWGCDLAAVALLRGVDKAVGLDDVIRSQTEGVVDPDRLTIGKLQYSVADDIAREFDAVPNTLIVMNTDAHVRSAALAENVSEQVMRSIRQPLLLLGHDASIDADWPNAPIMVCTDGSDFAESVGALATSWAQSLNLPLMLVTVIDPAQVPAGVSHVAETNSVARFAADLEKMAAETSPGSPIEINYDALHGSDTDDAIVDYAKNGTASMIIMATHGRSGVQRALYGSVTMNVVRKATCPVVVLRP